ncbi:MAG: DoxX family protein [Nanoarchaeota archaeon]
MTAIETLVPYATIPLRILLGIIFIAHGYPKLFKFKDYKEKFKAIGFPPFVLALVGIAEFVGGIGTIFGFLTRFTAIVWIIMMIVATYLKAFKWNKGLVEGYELDLTILAGALTLFILGAGPLSIDALIGWSLG